MSLRRSLGSLSLPMLSMATALALGMPSCSSDDTAPYAGPDAAGSGGDGSASRIDGGGKEGGKADATTGADAGDGGTGAESAATGDGGGASDGSGDDGSATADTGMQAVDVGVPPPVLCPVETPLMTNIVDFTPRGPNASTDGYSWGSFGTDFSGYTYYYNQVYIKSDVTTGVWHMTGNVLDYSGFGLGFNCMIDASAYAGVEFTIQGNAGIPNQLTFSVTTAADDVPGDPANPGYARCVPASNLYDGTCAEPRVIIDVTSTLTTVSLRWKDLLAGRPSPVNPAEITRLTWAFAWPYTSPDGSVGYPIDVTIGHVAFIRDSSASGDASSDGSSTDGSADATSSEASTDGASTTDVSSTDGSSTDATPAADAPSE
jgi:hypothetical protein